MSAAPEFTFLYIFPFVHFVLSLSLYRISMVICLHLRGNDREFGGSGYDPYGLIAQRAVKTHFPLVKLGMEPMACASVHAKYSNE